jgi:hypothetical protein
MDFTQVTTWLDEFDVPVGQQPSPAGTGRAGRDASPALAISHDLFQSTIYIWFLPVPLFPIFFYVCVFTLKLVLCTLPLSYCCHHFLQLIISTIASLAD